MAWTNGGRRRCPECGQPVAHIPDVLSHRELRGPRQITSSNVDRAFDNNGHILFIEEKHPREEVPAGQAWLLRSLARPKSTTVWLARGVPDNLLVWRVGHTQPGDSVVFEGGDFDDYQAAVSAWYAHTSSATVKCK